uniref:ATP synthase F0 subunit 8 n=1 Tax=Allorhynchium sp. YN TaxID=2742724 RepID=A0A6M9AX12_9HYME|nr:ATP synthase F0 subunit 8 [Allorhynchium sp. YN]QKK69210.1 ATP synthase F0 subunit 8 [Allorhynchium sp. YN]
MPQLSPLKWFYLYIYMNFFMFMILIKFNFSIIHSPKPLITNMNMYNLNWKI